MKKYSLSKEGFKDYVIAEDGFVYPKKNLEHMIIPYDSCNIILPYGKTKVKVNLNQLRNKYLYKIKNIKILKTKINKKISEPIIIYTDGSFKNNLGGYAALIKMQHMTKVIYGSGNTINTNNRAELYAVISALETLQDINNNRAPTVTVISDSQYVVNGCTKWIYKWRKNHWNGVKNKDLWIKIYDLLKSTNPTFRWVKAHTNKNDIDSKHNRIVDQLAKKATTIHPRVV